MFIILSSVLPAQETLTFDIGDWEPFTSSRDTGSRVLEQLVEEVFSQYGIEVEFNYYPWLRCLKNIENGLSDGSFPLMQTEERDKNTLASKEPILIEDNVFFHMKDFDFHWANLGDLKGLRIGGTIGYGYMKPIEDSGLEVEYVPKEELNFRKLLADHLDIYPASLHVGSYVISMLFDKEDAARFTYDEKVLDSQDYYLLISRKNPDAQILVDKFDEGLRMLKANGRYDEIMRLLPDSR